LLVEPGSKIPVGTVLALLRSPGESAEQVEAWHCERASPSSEARTEENITAMPHPVAAADTAGTSIASPRSRISPAARRRAETLGVDFTEIEGTGPDGAICIEDVERAAHPAKATAEPLRRTEQMRRAIAVAMTRSKREIPHYYLAKDIALKRATQWLADVNGARPVTARLLMAAVFICAVVRTIKKYPELNGFFRDDRFEPCVAVHAGVAISLREGGLIAPAILDANDKSLDQIMRDLSDLVQRTRAYRLRSLELSSPTVTVTNLGQGGAQAVFGVVYPPQVALVGFGAVSERAYAEGGVLGAMPMVTVALCADHRVSDGHRGAGFLSALDAILQHPETL
jgi:pyruvate dehydrogenase E2 component (dihydrolipoamide acetyltransferase)